MDLEKIIAVAQRHREQRRRPEEKCILFRLHCPKAQGRPTVAVLSWAWIAGSLHRHYLRLQYVDEGDHWYATGQLFVKHGEVIEQSPIKGQTGYAVIVDRQVIRITNLTAIGQYLRCEIDLEELLARKDGNR